MPFCVNYNIDNTLYYLDYYLFNIIMFYGVGINNEVIDVWQWHYYVVTFTDIVRLSIKLILSRKRP